MLKLDEVCHYTKKKTVFLILSTRKLRFTQFKFTNDPRESKERNFPTITRLDLTPSTSTAENYSDSITEISNKIASDEWKALCVTLHHPPKRTNANDRDVSEKIYNQTLRQGYSHPRMWAQYAENHHGVCLIFDGNILNKNIHSELGAKNKVFQGQVLYGYNKLYPLGIPFGEKLKHKELIESLRHFYITHHRVVFLRKHPDWRHEVEYRWLIHNNKRSHEYVSITGAIKAVLVGIDFPKKDEYRLLELCKELKIPAGRMNWNNGLPQPHFGSIYQP